MGLAVEVAGKTDAGCVRANNEDSFDYDTGAGVFVVCDGMGGHAAGEVASGMAVRTVVDYFRARATNTEQQENADPECALQNAIFLANDRIRKSAARIPAQEGMGSTIAAALLTGDRASIAHVGDSRVYLIRDHAIECLTADHSLVMEGVRNGLMSLEEAQNSGVQNIILRALGAEDSVQPDTTTMAVAPGDVLLLTSDGLMRHVDDEQILRIVDSAPSVEEACSRLIKSAKDAGGSDNVTCLLVRIAGDAP